MTDGYRAHLVTGGFPPGASAGHDMDYARRRLLEALGGVEGLRVTTANDFVDIERWLPGCDFLVTYVAGPFPQGAGNAALAEWLDEGGRWFALHGTSGGKAARFERDGRKLKPRLAKMLARNVGGALMNRSFSHSPPSLTKRAGSSATATQKSRLSIRCWRACSTRSTRRGP